MNQAEENTQRPGGQIPTSLIPVTSAAGASRALAGGVGVDLGAPPDLPVAQRPFSLRLLLRFKWTILLVFLVVAPLGVLAVRAVFVSQYTSSALIEIYSVVPRLVVETDETGPISQYERYVQTQADIMRSTPVLQRVLERQDVQQSAWFVAPPPAWQRWVGEVPPPIERLATAVEATPRKRTELLELSVTTAWPADSALLANAILDEYLKFARERFSEKDRALHDALTEEQRKLASEIRFLEQAVTETRRELLSPSPDELIAQRRVRLDQYEADLRRLDLEMDVLRQELAQLEAASTQPSEAAATPVLAWHRADPEWRRLYEQWKAAEQRTVEAANQFGQDHPTMVRLRQAQEAAKALLDERQHELHEAGVPLPTSGMQASSPGAGAGPRARDPLTIRYELRLAELRKQRLEREVDELRQSFQSDFGASERLRQKTDELERSKERYSAVMGRLEELAEKTKVPASIRTISRAVAPSSPKDNKRLKLTIAALVGALVAGIGGAFLRIRLSTRVEDVGDVGRAVPATFLWELPLESARCRASSKESADRAEGIRMLRTSLLGRLGRHRGNTLQITSAGPGSGKSTLAAHLSQSLAHCGKSVLLVEADLCRPGLAARFGVASTPGLIDLLSQGVAAGTAVLETDTPGLRVIPAGRLADPAHAELLANGDFSALLAEWRRSYEFIVFDSPPLLLTADAAILAGHVDGTVIVVRERHCRRAELMEAYTKLVLAGGKLLGTAFIGSRHRRYGHNYGYGYGYDHSNGHDAADVPAATVTTPPT